MPAAMEETQHPLCRIGGTYDKKTDADMIHMIKDCYGLDVRAITPMSMGVVGDTYRITTARDNFIFKILEGK